WCFSRSAPVSRSPWIRNGCEQCSRPTSSRTLEAHLRLEGFEHASRYSATDAGLGAVLRASAALARPTGKAVAPARVTPRRMTAPRGETALRCCAHDPSHACAACRERQCCAFQAAHAITACRTPTLLRLSRGASGGVGGRLLLIAAISARPLLAEITS